VVWGGGGSPRSLCNPLCGRGLETRGRTSRTTVCHPPFRERRALLILGSNEQVVGSNEQVVGSSEQVVVSKGRRIKSNEQRAVSKGRRASAEQKEVAKRGSPALC
jgi:hypothetical protein